MFLSIQEIVSISAGVVSKCNGRVVGGLFQKYFQKAKIVLPFSWIFLSRLALNCYNCVTF